MLTIIAIKVRFRKATFPHLVAHLERVPVFHTILQGSKALQVSQGEKVALREDVVALVLFLFIITLQKAPRGIWPDAAGGRGGQVEGRGGKAISETEAATKEHVGHSNTPFIEPTLPDLQGEGVVLDEVDLGKARPQYPSLGSIDACQEREVAARGRVGEDWVAIISMRKEGQV